LDKARVEARDLIDAYFDDVGRASGRDGVKVLMVHCDGAVDAGQNGIVDPLGQ
jgi:hypothetical protein